MILKRSAFPLLLLLILLATVGGCATPVEAPPVKEAPPAKEEGEIQRVVEVKTDGLTLHYLRQSCWGKAELAKYLANQAQFKADFKADFEQRLAQNGVSASDYSFSFDSTTQSTLIQCDIHNAVTSTTAGKYTARFEWLELPQGFDLLNFDKTSKDTLTGQTEINGTPVTFTLVFPAPIGNCHYHVWWSD